MNKGVVLELNNDVATLLSEDGRFVRVKAFPGTYKGMEVVYTDMDIVRKKTTKKSSYRFGFSRLAAAVIVGFALMSGSYVYYDYNYAVYASVTLDVNPSMQLDIGKQSQVVSVEELNNDAEKLLEGVELKGKPVDAAIMAVESKLQEKGYFKSEEENFMLLGYVRVKEDANLDTLKAKIEESAIKEAKAENIHLQVKSVTASSEVAKKIKKTNDKLSIGRETYVNQLKNDGIIDKSTDASTAKIPALFESHNKAISGNPALVTTVTPTAGDGNGTVTITETLNPTPTLADNGQGTLNPNGEGTKNIESPTITAAAEGSTTPNTTTTITIIPNEEKGDKTNDNNKYNGGKKKQDVQDINNPETTPIPTVAPVRTADAMDSTPALSTSDVPVLPLPEERGEAVILTGSAFELVMNLEEPMITE